MIPITQSTLIFFVNGKKVIDPDVDPEWTLLQYLRKKLRLCGTKLGCGEGGCGACTVMVSKLIRKTNTVIHFPVNACLAPICSMHGLAVTTVEGIGSTSTKLHPVQERIAKSHGSQCGFCTPGIVMSMYTLLRQKDKPKMIDMETALQGNLCRCTGYRPILEGYKTFTEDWEVMQTAAALSSINGNGCAMGDQCCKNTKKLDDDEVLFNPSEFTPYDPSQEPIFPPELKLSDALDFQNLFFKGKSLKWYRPTQLKDLLELKSEFPHSKLVVGNTEVGVEVKFKHFNYPVIIHPTLIPEMIECTVQDDGINIGASITLEEMQDILVSQIKTQPAYKTRIFKSIVDMLHWFAGKQIRSVASVGGNIMTGSPISDLNPIFMSAEIELKLQSKTNTRIVVFNQNFFTGYRTNIANPDEILISIKIPYTNENQHFYAYKQAKRRYDDIAIVNSAMSVTIEKETLKIVDLKLAFGGMAPTTVRALNTEKNLIGLKWNNDTLEKSFTYLIEDLPLPPNAPGGMIQFRRTLTLSFFFRTFYKILCDLNIPIDPKYKSALDGFHNKTPKSSQYFEVVSKEQSPYDPIGRPIQHLSAFKQATGEAVYCDDIPKFENEVCLGFVLSSKPYANILSLDPTEALKCEGVQGFISAKDLAPEKNLIGLAFPDEEIFISKTVTSQYQILGVIVADDHSIAQKASRLVKIEYEELAPVILTIDDAIKHDSIFPDSVRKIEFGDIDKGFKIADHVIEGECRSGYQEHFYLETQSVIAVPKKEDGEMEIFAAAQHPAEINNLVSKALGVHQNRVTVKIKRLGGGFGGKDYRTSVLSVISAIVARKYQRPVRTMLDRDEDMVMTGGRHPFLYKYKLAFNGDGQLLAVDMLVYNNAGYSTDYSIAVLEQALFHITNAYKVPNVRVQGFSCKTNLPSNTAFRGFGTPQSVLVAETMIREVAEYLNKDVLEVMKMNFYQEGDVLYYNQTLTDCNLQKCWYQCLDSSEYARRKTEVEKYNSENRWKKRGISVVPLQYGIAFNMAFFNQGGALVLIYQDGSVLLTHGGVEMGQGLHTKMIQVASRALGIPHSKIHTIDNSTDKIPNTSTTGGSASSDLNGMAILNACETINKRLEPIKKKYPNSTWEEWIKAAYLERISLSSTGFYKTPDLCYSFETNSGQLKDYYVYGTAVTEVEIDCLTGDHQVLRTDIVMDLGSSLNPAIDIGQIEGGFMQGYGLCVLEEMMFSPTGAIHTRGPGAYKIPSFGDIPVEFNVSLLKGATNPRAVYSSKAVGEPPLCLACSALFAIREAIKSARADAGLQPSFKLNAPATAARIRINCQDHLIDKIKLPEPGSFVPWNIENI